MAYSFSRCAMIDLQRFPVKIYCTNLCIRFGSNVDPFMYLIERNRFGSWKDRRFNWASGGYACSIFSTPSTSWRKNAIKRKALTSKNNYFPLYISYTLSHVLLLASRKQQWIFRIGFHCTVQDKRWYNDEKYSKKETDNI